MATYAAFKHIELYNVGKAKKRVLKPPGGGSSDIFGNGNGHTVATPRSNKGHMASNIFAPPMEKTCNGDNNRRNPNMDSHNRLFGEVERPYTPAKNHFKSSIPLGGADSVDSTPRTNGTNGTKKETNGHTNGNGHANGISNANGNSNGEAMIANGTNGKHEPINSPNNSNSSSILSPRSPPNTALTPRRKLNAPLDNLPIQPIEIDTHVQFNGTAPLTNTTNSSSFSSSTDDSNYGFAKSPRLSQRNPVTGMGIQDTFHRGRRMDGRRDGNPVTGRGYITEINTAVPALNGSNTKPAPALNGTKQVINKNRVPPGGFSSGLW